MLNELVEINERQKQRALNDVQFTGDIVKDFRPLVDQLGIMIQVGYDDKKAYDDETELLKINSNPEDIDSQDLINYREKLSQAFGEKLDKLGNMLIQYKNQINSYQMQQLVYMKIVGNKEDFLKHSSKVLLSQGSIIVRARMQADELEQDKALNDAINKAITENAKEVVANVQAAIDLDVNGGITTETLQTVSNLLGEGVKLWKDGRRQKQEKIKQNIVVREQLKNAANEYNHELLTFLEGEVETKVPTKIQGNPQKRLGGK